MRRFMFSSNLLGSLVALVLLGTRILPVVSVEAHSSTGNPSADPGQTQFRSLEWMNPTWNEPKGPNRLACTDGHGNVVQCPVGGIVELPVPVVENASDSVAAGEDRSGPPLGDDATIAGAIAAGAVALAAAGWYVRRRAVR